MIEKETKRERSAIYPYASWHDCIVFIKQVDSFRASQVSYDEVAKKFGVSTQTLSFKAKLSTSKQFGLIDTSGGVISLSSTSKKLLYPMDDDENKIVFECFEKPPLYEKLIGIYNGKALPTEVVLSNVLMNDHAIARNAKDTAAQFFILNATEMGFVRAGVLDYSLKEGKGNISEAAEILEAGLNEKEVPQTPAHVAEQIAVAQTKRDNDYITQIIPVESGKAAKIMIPLEATEDDLWLIRDTLDIIMKRKFKITID